jgi:hypothetical protein
MATTPILEFRRYTLRPGQRDRLIDLFEAELLDPQEELGMTIMGMFRELDDPSKFVWLREFSSLEDRPRALESFYYGPIWRQHSDAANATMVDSDDVLLLRPARAGSNLKRQTAPPPRAAAAVVEATILYFGGPITEPILTYFEQEIAPAVADVSGSILGWFVTVQEPNNFPALAVREGENALVWFARSTKPSADIEAHGGVAEVAAQAPGIVRRPQLLRLAPTRRSRLRGRGDGPRTVRQRDGDAVAHQGR